MPRDFLFIIIIFFLSLFVVLMALLLYEILKPYIYINVLKFENYKTKKIDYTIEMPKENKIKIGDVVRLKCDKILTKKVLSNENIIDYININDIKNINKTVMNGDDLFFTCGVHSDYNSLYRKWVVVDFLKINKYYLGDSYSILIKNGINDYGIIPSHLNVIIKENDKKLKIKKQKRYLSYL